MSEPPRGTATTSALRGRPASPLGELVVPGLRSGNRRLTASRLRLSTRHYIVRRWDPACRIRRWDRASAAPALDLASENRASARRLDRPQSVQLSKSEAPACSSSIDTPPA